MALGNLIKKGIGGVGGAALGGAALAGGAISQSIGLTPYLVGATAIGAAGKKGADWLGSKSLSGMGSDGKDKEDTTEELGKVTQYGLLSVEKLDAIYNNVVDIRKVLADQDPVAQEREKALDEEVKNKELINAIRGVGGGGGAGGGTNKSGFNLGGLLKGLGLAGLVGLLSNLDAESLDKFFDTASDWAEKINNAIDNIMEFIKDLDGFFESIGVEFGGAMTMAFSRALKTANRFRPKPGAGKKAYWGASPEEKKAIADKRKKKADKIRSERRKLRAARLKAAAATAKGKAVSKSTQKKIQKGTNWQEAERDRLREQRAKNAAAAKAQADAEKARAERERARGERLRNAAAKIGAKVKGVFRPDTVKPPAGKGPNVTTGAFRPDTVKPKGQGPMGKIAAAVAGATASVLRRGPKSDSYKPNAYQKGYSNIRWSGVDDVKPKGPGGMVSGIISSILPKSTGGRPGGAPKKNAYAEGYDKIKWKGQDSVKPKGRGGMISGITSLIKPWTGVDDVKPKGQGGMGPAYPPAKTPNPNVKGRSNTAGGKLLAIPPKQLEKIKQALRIMPESAINAIARVVGTTAEKVRSSILTGGRVLLNVAGPILLWWEIDDLWDKWKLENAGTPSNKSPFYGEDGPDNQADANFADGLRRILATYTGAYVLGTITGILGAKLGLAAGPLGSFLGMVIGGGAGAFVGGTLAANAIDEWAMQDWEKIKIKKDKISELESDIARGTTKGGKKYRPAMISNKLKEIDMLQQEILELEKSESKRDDIILKTTGTHPITSMMEAQGPIDEPSLVYIANTYADRSKHMSQASASSAQISMDTGPAPVRIYDGGPKGFFRHYS